MSYQSTGKLCVIDDCARVWRQACPRLPRDGTQHDAARVAFFLNICNGGFRFSTVLSHQITEQLSVQARLEPVLVTAVASACEALFNFTFRFHVFVLQAANVGVFLCFVPTFRFSCHIWSLFSPASVKVTFRLHLSALSLLEMTEETLVHI